MPIRGRAAGTYPGAIKLRLQYKFAYFGGVPYPPWVPLPPPWVPLPPLILGSPEIRAPERFYKVPEIPPDVWGDLALVVQVG